MKFSIELAGRRVRLKNCRPGFFLVETDRGAFVGFLTEYGAMEQAGKDLWKVGGGPDAYNEAGERSTLSPGDLVTPITIKVV